MVHSCFRRMSMVAGLMCLACAAQAAPAFTTLLPRDVLPVHYELRLTPDAAALKFAGQVRIELKVLKPTRRITLNALDLDLRSARIDAQVAAIEIDPKAQTASFVLAKPLKAGAHRLSIDYIGTIGTQPSGLFALDYLSAGAKKRALYTQFEPADARRMFPCWDEPALKATFSLQLMVRESDGLAVSNMPVAARKALPGGRVQVRFTDSPKMSTYLLFFALGDFERTVAKRAGTEIAVVTQQGDAPKAGYALSAAADILDWYDHYFGAKYPLPKLDLIAAPGQSQFFAAMENWGAIFYFDRALLLDPAFSSVDDRRGVFEVVAHEVAHQWFGDLVTMGWWDDLWLNEGFASWMADRVTARLHPEWNLALAAVDSREAAIRLDALASTHAVVQHIRTPEELNQAFDSITYSKGSAVIRMLEAYVGEAAWRDGVRRYIATHALGNTRSDDLWLAVESAAGKPVRRIAHEFTLQPGVPLIRVEDAHCRDGRTTLRLAQGEFQMDRAVSKPRDWQVPVTVGTTAQTATVLVNGHATASVPGCGPPVVNRGQGGYFRTLYEPAAFEAIAHDYATLHAVDQLGVLSDAWALGLTAQQPVTDALDLLRELPSNTAPEVWQRAAGIVSFIGDFTREDLHARAALAKFAGARLGAKLAELGWIGSQGEADNVSSLRNTLITVLGELGDPQVLAEARRRFEADGTHPIRASQRQAIFGVVATNADAATWERLHAMAKTEATPVIRAQLYEWLGSTLDPQLAQRALELSLSGEPHETDAAGIISSVAQMHPRLAFDFAVAHAQAVRSKVDVAMQDDFIVRLARRADDLQTLSRLEQWAHDNVPQTAFRVVDTVTAQIRYRTTVRTERLPQINAWMSKTDG